jgi:amino acid transporter
VFAGRFIDPSIGFAVSWSYWFNIITGLASELLAGSNVVAYWAPVCNGKRDSKTMKGNTNIEFRIFQLGLCQLSSG